MTVDFILFAAVLLYGIFAVRKIYQRKKRGSCCGSCPSCAECTQEKTKHSNKIQ